jgi:HEAT repeat protein
MKGVASVAASASLAILIFEFWGGTLLAQPAQRRAWRILEASLKDKSAQKRIDALQALGFLPGDPHALRMARRALRDERPSVRAAAATVLGQMVSTDSIPELKKMLADPNPTVVIAATNALWSLRDPTAYEIYYELLTGERKGGVGLTTQAREALHNPSELAKIGVEQGIGFVPYLSFGYSAIRLLMRNDASPVRAAAARDLASDPDPRTARALLRATHDSSSIVRTAALGAIAKRGNPALLKGIMPALWDDNLSVRDMAAAAVIRLTTIAQSVGTAAEIPTTSGAAAHPTSKN